MKTKFLLLFLVVFSSFNLFSQVVTAETEKSRNLIDLKVIDNSQTSISQIESSVSPENSSDTANISNQSIILFTQKYDFDKAQLQQQFPELVREGSNGQLSVDYNSFILLQLLEIQELRRQVEALTGELELLRNNTIK